jgi:hypothetical protein
MAKSPSRPRVPKSSAATATQERRIWVRQETNLRSSCEPIAMPTASQPEMKWPARISDISAGGVGLTLRRRFERGSKLTVELPSASRGTSQLRSVFVMRVQAINGKNWLLGCEWEVPLTDEELQAVL